MARFLERVMNPSLMLLESTVCNAHGKQENSRENVTDGRYKVFKLCGQGRTEGFHAYAHCTYTIRLEECVV